MKKFFFISVLLLALVTTIDAQLYSINKLKYDYHLYTPEYGDPYNPALSGIFSFFLPGLGQVLCGETSRGLGFFGAYTGCAIIYGVGAFEVFNSSYYQNTPIQPTINGTMLLGAGGMLAVYVWSIVDAINVAKVNNMYVRDRRKTSEINLKFAPYLEPISINNQVTVPVGLSMRVTF